MKKRIVILVLIGILFAVSKKIFINDVKKISTDEIIVLTFDPIW